MKGGGAILYNAALRGIRDCTTHPPIPEDSDCTTPTQRRAVMAASTAEPPFSKMPAAILEQTGASTATAPLDLAPLGTNFARRSETTTATANSRTAIVIGFHADRQPLRRLRECHFLRTECLYLDDDPTSPLRINSTCPSSKLLTPDTDSSSHSFSSSPAGGRSRSTVSRSRRLKRADMTVGK